MIRTILLLLIAGILGLAQTAPKPQPTEKPAKAVESKPKAVPVEKHEEISRAMIRLQAAQLAASQTQRELEKAGQAYEALMNQVRKDAGAAAGCELTIDKEWHCGPETPAAGK
jgi:uncharacterized protein YkwD